VVAVIVGAESGISWRRPAQAQPVARWPSGATRRDRYW